jgi:hypothetical protein
MYPIVFLDVPCLEVFVLFPDFTSYGRVGVVLIQMGKHCFPITFSKDFDLIML